MGENKSINGKMEEYHIKIWNASDDEIISARIAPFGFTAEKMTALKTLYNETAALVEMQKKEKAEWRVAGENFNQALNTAKKEFNAIRNRLKFFYPANHPVAESLELYRDNFSRYADFLAGAKFFYAKLAETAETLEKMAPFGTTAETVTALAGEIDNLDQLKEIRERESGDAQYATKERNTKLDELDEACNELTRLAKLIFEDDEAQYLEKLGILARS